MIIPEEAIEELRTFGDIVRWGATHFAIAELTFGHGTDNALDESYAMVRHVLQLPHEIPPYMINTRLTKNERRHAIDFLMERITTRKPLAYLIHEAWFAGLSFYVDERVIIPRSPIAELIQQRFEPWIDPNRVLRILDLCTGSGCIAIACAYAFPEAHIDAIELSKDALNVAKFNIEIHGLNERINLIESNLFDALSMENPAYDIIVTNPPYVNAADMASLTEEFKHEPVMALEAGEDGLNLVHTILADAPKFLAPEGILVVEVGNSADALMAQYPSTPFMWPEFEHGGHGVFVLSAEQLVEQNSIV